MLMIILTFEFAFKKLFIFGCFYKTWVQIKYIAITDDIANNI